MMASKEIIMIDEEQPCNKLLPLQTKAPGIGRSDFPGRRNRAVDEITENPDWLPSCWITESRIRKRGSSAGKKDKYYFEPLTGKRFRSEGEVQRYLQTGSKKQPKGVSSERAKSAHAASGEDMITASSWNQNFHPVRNIETSQVLGMRGQLSFAEVEAYEDSNKFSSYTALVPWNPGNL